MLHVNKFSAPVGLRGLTEQGGELPIAADDARYRFLFFVEKNRMIKLVHGIAQPSPCKTNGVNFNSYIGLGFLLVTVFKCPLLIVDS